MRMLARLVVLSFAVGICLSACETNKTATQEVLENQFVSPLAFGLDIVRESAPCPFAVSPVAYYELFGLMRIGAGVNTKRLLSPYQIPPAEYAQINKASNDVYFLRISDVWAENSKEFCAWYGDTLTNNGFMYHSVSRAEALEFINGWFEEQTLGTVFPYFEQEECPKFSERTVLFTNAVTFEGEWQKPFVAYEQDVFHQRPEVDNEHAIAPPRVERYVRNGESEGWYFENEKEQVLSLSFKDTSYRLMIVMPRESLPSEHPWEGYSVERIKELHEALEYTKNIDIHLVSFKTEANLYISALDNSNSTLEQLSGLFVESMSYPKMFTTPETLDLAPITQRCIFSLGIEGTDYSEDNSCSLPVMESNLRAARKFVTERPFLYVLYREDIGIDNALLVGIYE